MKSFAVSSGRNIKALKIEAVLRDALNVKDLSGYSILDIGAGSGHISSFFSSKNRVVAADVVNQICIIEPNFSFVELNQEKLPFESSFFDVVILNQVLTYVADQLNELKEVNRILKPGGICYISMPNKTFPIEPHSKVPFIHYLPHELYQLILNFITKSKTEVRMHKSKGMIDLFVKSGFSAEDYTVEILSNPSKYYIKSFLRLPSWRWISNISPTNIFILKAKL